MACTVNTELLMLWRWDREGIANGEWWRLVTGHLVHLDMSHAVLNLAAIALMLIIVGRAWSARRWFGLIVVAMVVIDAGLWWLTDLEWYVGFSGVVHAMAAAALVQPLVARDPLAWVVGLLGLTKLLYEIRFGALPFLVWAGGMSAVPVVTEVHALGAVAGLAYGLCGRLLTRAPQPTRT